MQIVGLLDHHIAGAYKARGEACKARCCGGDRHDYRHPRAGGAERHLLGQSGDIRLHRAFNGNAHRVIAGRRFGVDEIDAESRLIAHIEEAGQGALHHHRIAHDHIA